MKVKSYYLDYEVQNNHNNKGNVEEKDSFFKPFEEHYKLDSFVSKMNKLRKTLFKK